MENNQHGGVDTFCSTLINEWPDQKDSFVLICNESHPGKDYLKKEIRRNLSFIVHQIPLSWVVSLRLFFWVPSTLRKLRRIFQPFFRLMLYPLQYQAMIRLFNDIGGDALLVINGGYPGGESCRMANIVWAAMGRSPGIHNFHNFATLPRFGFRWYERFMDKKLLKSTNLFISVSRICAESLRVRKQLRDSTRIRYIYNGITTKNNRVRKILDLRRELSIGDNPLCLMLANYETRKGHSFLFKSFSIVAKAIPKAHLLVCGGGSEDEVAAVERMLSEIAPTANVHLRGFLEGGPDLINQADLVLISSQNFESFGLTAAEAMIRGVPVVSTRVGGLPEVIGEEADGGYLVAKDDVKGFGDSVIRLLKNPELRRELGARGRTRVRTMFSSERMAKEYCDALKRQ